MLIWRLGAPVSNFLVKLFERLWTRGIVEGKGVAEHSLDVVEPSTNSGAVFDCDFRLIVHEGARKQMSYALTGSAGPGTGSAGPGFEDFFVLLLKPAELPRNPHEVSAEALVLRRRIDGTVHDRGFRRDSFV